MSLSQQNSDKPTVFRFMAKCLPLYMFTALSLYHSICLPLYIFTALYVYRSSFSLEHILRVVPGFWMTRIYNKNKNNHLSVISQKGESQNGCFKKTKHATISKKPTFLTLWYARVRISGSEMFVFRKIWCAMFSWNTGFEIRSFALLHWKVLPIFPL